MSGAFRQVIRSWLAGAVLVLAPSVALAQSAFTGTVRDTSGAVLPGVTVEATSPVLIEGTKAAVTDANGAYRIVDLRPGTYTLVFSLTGFKAARFEGVELRTDFTATFNANLEVGALAETVTVTSEAVLLKTDKADVSVDLRPEDVTNAPLNQYRNYQTLLNLVPGATPPVFQNAQTDTPGRALSTNVNGANRNNNVTRIDGAASINVWLPHHAG